MKKKVALITGITGQDGSYLAELLIEKGYEVHGIKRRSSQLNTQRVDHLYQDPNEENRNFFLHYGDLTDFPSISNIVKATKPDEIYNLGAQSHVGVSFESPEYTANVDALGSLRILEAIRSNDLVNKTKYYQASSSELYGLTQEVPQNEKTPFYPRSPYAVAKLYAYWISINYREAYGIFACNGILFNHESSRRGETFVTRKITRGLANIAYGIEECLYLGNIDSKRDWGHAKDYVEMQWLMLQQDSPKDYVIATGKQINVRDFFRMSASQLGIKLSFHGEGLDEVAKVEEFDPIKTPSLQKNQTILKINPIYFRPSEVDNLLGDAALAAKELNWVPKISVEDLCKEMIEADIAAVKRDIILSNNKSS